MRRISVVGNSGAGKTTLARQLAAALGVPHLELDAVYHQAGWQPLPPQEFRALVAEFAAGDAWVIDGNYSTVQDLVWQRADTVIWIDLPRRRVMSQLLRRTLRRMASRQELWNGNRERWANFFRLDPAESILAWSWTQHHKYRERYGAAMTDPAATHLQFIRLATPAEIAALPRRAASS
jgi:adenylate kinase family enzyme